MRSPTQSPSLSRRALLRLAGGAAVAAVSAGCASNDEPAVATPDALLAEATRARTDAADAAAVALARPDIAGALGTVAAERTAHADALTAEVARLTPPPTTSDAAATTDTAGTVEASPPPTLDELRANLTASSTSAANLARTLSGYRAGLLGSISAACSVHVSAVLA
ncbi:hypothetical protein ACNHUS_10615 [Actinomycetes bacterium M1A6_2h]